MMHGREKSDSAIVATKNKKKKKKEREQRTGGGGGGGRGGGGAKGGGRGERGTGPHAPGAGPGKRVPGTGSRTARCKDTEDGTVHRAPPPRQPRSAPDGVLRSQAKCGSRRGRADVADLRGGPRSPDRGPACE